jgi:tripartite-type tricarboxylate transporter receptor subunit TctC
MGTMHRLAMLVCGALLFATTTQAQDYPNRPITLVVPLGAGGALDIISRSIAPGLEAQLGKPIVIENRTGGGTVIAAVSVAKAPADGYQLLFSPSGTLTTNTALYKKLPYDPEKDFVPVALTAKIPFVLVINPSLPVKTIPELVAYSKTHPLSYGSTGTGAAPHLITELFKNLTGLQATHVPYKGAVPAMTDVVGGHIHMTFADPSITRELLDAGKVRALGVSSLTRAAQLPEVPPIAELSVPGFEGVSWHLVVAPAGTPDAVVEKLRSAFKAAMADAEIQKKVIGMGVIPVDSPPKAELVRFVADEKTRWSKIVEQVGIAGTE